jgi:predicted nucleic acid-binding protein
MLHRRQLSIGWITPAIHEEALNLFRRHSDRQFSIADCASFVVARRKKVHEVFGFDGDFISMGFVLRPSN